MKLHEQKVIKRELELIELIDNTDKGGSSEGYYKVRVRTRFNEMNAYVRPILFRKLKHAEYPIKVMMRSKLTQTRTMGLVGQHIIKEVLG